MDIQTLSIDTFVVIKITYLHIVVKSVAYLHTAVNGITYLHTLALIYTL